MLLLLLLLWPARWWWWVDVIVVLHTEASHVHQVLVQQLGTQHGAGDVAIVVHLHLWCVCV